MDFFLQTALGMWQVIGRMAPYLLFGFLMAGALSQIISPEWIARHLGGNRFASVFKAAIFGVPLPMCSCGVIPLAATLRGQGASKGATTGFLISTPQTGADSILVNYALIGPVFALVTPIAAFTGGLLGGFLVDATRPRDQPDENPATTSALADCCQNDACAEFLTPTEAPSGFLPRVQAGLTHALITMPRDIARPIVIGLFIAALLGALLPDDFFSGILGAGLPAMLIVMAAAIPMYACSTGSIPIAAMLIAKGVAPGVALVFLLTGPAINAATITTVIKTLGPRCAAILVATVATIALLAGHAVNAIYALAPISIPQFHQTPEAMGAFAHFSALVLVAILGYALYSQFASKTTAPANTGKEAQA